MRRTTPPRPLDILQQIPELAEYARDTTRLHPRRGVPGVGDSSVGGPLLWPAEEPWPCCSVPFEVQRSEPVPPDLAVRIKAKSDLLSCFNDPRIRGRVVSHEPDGSVMSRWSEPEPHDTPNPMVAIAQLHAADVPTVTFPEGRNLLQVLWCPVDHLIMDRLSYGGPAIQLVWRTAETVGPLLIDPPQPHTFDADFYLPRPCVLHPEQVTEYQYSDLLPEELRDRVSAADARWGETYGLSYQSDLSIAPGCKAGGWATWNVTDPWDLRCAACGSEFDLLLNLDSKEWDGIVSWKPDEDDLGDEEACCPTGLTHGRWGATRIFVCSADPTHPFALDIQ